MKRIYYAFVITLILGTLFYPSVSASEMTRQYKEFDKVQIGSDLNGYATDYVNAYNNDALDYNNFNYTDMDNVFGSSGKYIYPLTPPMDFVPSNVSEIKLGSMFTMKDNIFGGMSDFWVRLPIMPSLTDISPVMTDDRSTGNLTMQIHRIESTTANFTTFGTNAPSFSGDSQMVWNYSYDLTQDNPFVDYYTVNYLNTTDEYSGMWCRVNTPIDTDSKYMIYFHYTIPADRQTLPVHVYLSQGDSFKDNIFDSWYYSDYQNTVYIPSDFDITIYLNDTLHLGTVCKSINPNQHSVNLTSIYRFYDQQTTTNEHINFVMPLWARDTSLTINFTIVYSNGSRSYYQNTSVPINGQEFIYMNVSVYKNAIINRVVVRLLPNEANKEVKVFLIQDQRGFDALQQGYRTTYITDASGYRYYNSTMLLYAYLSFDSFNYTVVTWDPFIVAYDFIDEPQFDLATITAWNTYLIGVEELQGRRLHQIRVTEAKLKLLGFWLLLPYQIIELALEGLLYLKEEVQDWWTNNKDKAPDGGPITDILEFLEEFANGIISLIMFFIEVVDLIVDYGPYIMLMTARIIMVVTAIIFGMIIFNTIDAIGEGIKQGNPIVAIANEWPKSQKMLVLMITIVSMMVGFLVGIVQAVIPL